MLKILIATIVSFILTQTICNVTNAQEAPKAPDVRSSLPRINLNIVLDPEMQFLEGIAHVQNTKDDAISIKTTGIEIKSASLDDNPSQAVKIEQDYITAPAHSQLTINFQKKLKQSPNTSADTPGNASGNFVNEDFLALLNNWCPEALIPVQYDLQVTAPMDFTVISEANQINEQIAARNKNTTFYFPFPRLAPTLVIGKYSVSSMTVEGITLQTYFFSHDKALSDTYLNKTAYYLNLYKKFLGQYPFKRFAIVENKAPTGFGHATFTLIGSDVLRLPFIADTSLGHEFVHNWFGNGIYVDYKQGNWCEGLTTYLSDYLYDELKQQDKEHRKRILTEHQSYVNKDNAISASDFVSQQDRASRAVGYGKMAMFFHMLRLELGDEIFWTAIKRFIQENLFKVASWQEILKAFEATTNKAMSKRFEQWIKRNDLPELSIKLPENFNVLSPSITIEQLTETPYEFSLPIRLHTHTGDREIKPLINQKIQTIELGKGIVNSVLIDPDYQVMRRLDSLEFRPVLSRLFGATNKAMVVEEAEKEKYKPALEFLNAKGFELITDAKDVLSKATDYSILFFGNACSKSARLTGRLSIETRGTKVEVLAHPFDERLVLGCLVTSEPDALKEVMPKLTHYGKYSELQFEGAKNTTKKIDSTKQGIEFEITPPFWALTKQGKQGFAELLENLKTKQIILVGEKHDDFSHHLAQLEVIKGLNEARVPLAVGMEMFQKPFQQVLDRYVNKEISELEFLEQSEFMKRWGHGYALYRPILNYCRDNKIPVIALNLEKEVSSEIGRQGLKSVLEGDKAEKLPASINWSSLEQKKWLEQIYDQHPQKEVKDAVSFYQAQVMWDETMAESIASYLQMHPQKHMVVLAGAGHVTHEYAIPARLKNRLGRPDLVSVVMPTGQEYPEEEGWDALLFVPPVSQPFSAKLGIIADEAVENTVVIKEIMPESTASQAGLMPGDTIVKADQVEISGIFALRTVLALKKEGDEIELQIKRADASLESKKVIIKANKSPHGNMTKGDRQDMPLSPHKK